MVMGDRCKPEALKDRLSARGLKFGFLQRLQPDALYLHFEQPSALEVAPSMLVYCATLKALTSL